MAMVVSIIAIVFCVMVSLVGIVIAWSALDDLFEPYIKENDDGNNTRNQKAVYNLY